MIYYSNTKNPTIYFNKNGFTINESNIPNISIVWNPWKHAHIYIRTKKHRLSIGPGIDKDWKGIDKGFL